MKRIKKIIFVLITVLILGVLCILGKWKFDEFMARGTTPSVPVKTITSPAVYNFLFDVYKIEAVPCIKKIDKGVVVRHQLEDYPNIYLGYKLTDFNIKCAIVTAQKRETMDSLLTKLSRASKDVILDAEVIDMVLTDYFAEKNSYDYEIVIDAGGNLSLFLLIDESIDAELNLLNRSLIQELYDNFGQEKAMHLYTAKTERLQEFEDKMFCYLDESFSWHSYSFFQFIHEKQ